ncbi:MAG: penicillin-binding protein 2 [Tannerellaceae bacterium]|jgi:penicillin-binding protein 2|nr:penicillin-binding protein 2 [Tannerellaceae bacterium]
MGSKNRAIILANRQYVISAVFIAVIVIFVIRLFYLQVLNVDYRDWADSNAFLKRTIYPSRGMIYDRQGRLLVYNQPAYDVMVIKREIIPFDTADFCTTLGISYEWLVKRFKDITNKQLNPGYSPYVPQVLVPQLSVQEYGAFQEKLYKFPGFYVRNRTLRDYQYSCAAHILGNVGEVGKHDIEEDDYYVQGDHSGRSGVELSYERDLRGEKGIEILLRDAHGRIKGQYDNGIQDIAAIPGKDITLAIDIELQAYGELLMHNKIGSIVMIDPTTGEILCMVSAPSYDPHLLAGRHRGRNHDVLAKDMHKPLFDRSIMGTYPPGSTFKPAQGLIFLEEGVINQHSLYTCNRGYTYTGGKPACHRHSSPLSLIPAVATSCNSFFSWGLRDMLDNRHRYKTIQGAFDRWKDLMVAMGYGYTLDIDLPGEKRGYIPNSRVYDNVYHERWTSSTVISIAIGQGEVTATPLQMCNLAATIANRGFYITPHVVSKIGAEDIPSEKTVKHFTGIDREHYDLIAAGMRLSVIGGTCYGANIPDIEICGKTGTAENPHGADHSAFIGFAPHDNPTVAIAVYVENGGWGANFGVPIGRLMMQKYLRGNIPPSDLNLEERMISTSTIQFYTANGL